MTTALHPARTLHVRQMYDQPVAVITTVGDPELMAQSVEYALQGVVEALETRGEPAVGRHVRARWTTPQKPDHARWVTRWAVPIPSTDVDLPRTMHGFAVHAELWRYGTVAEAIHHGAYDTLAETDADLRGHIRAAGYEVTGDHEEEFLSPPSERVPRTVIRYPVEPAAAE